MKKIFILLIGILLVSGCVQPEPPKAVYQHVKVGKANLQGVELNFVFDVENKNPIDLQVSEYSYRIKINGREIVSEARPGFTLPGASSKRLEIPIFVRYDKVFDSVLGIAADVLSGKTYFDFDVDGSISAGAAGITVPVPIKAAGRVKV